MVIGGFVSYKPKKLCVTSDQCLHPNCNKETVKNWDFCLEHGKERLKKGKSTVLI